MAPRRNVLLLGLLLAASLLAGSVDARRHHRRLAGANRRANFDYFYLVRQWPATFCNDHSCTHRPPKKYAFTVHGLWPQRRDGTWPEYCDPSSHLRMDQLYDLLPDLERVWPSWSSADETFWDHEWNRHGTCAAAVVGGQHSFFESVLRLHSRLNIQAALDRAGIRPSNSARYPVQDIKDAIEEEHGVMPHVTCDATGALAEVWMCLNKKLRPIDCVDGPHPHTQLSSGGHDGAALDADGELTAAPAPRNNNCNMVRIPKLRRHHWGEEGGDEEGHAAEEHHHKKHHEHEHKHEHEHEHRQEPGEGAVGFAGDEDDTIAAAGKGEQQPLDAVDDAEDPDDDEEEEQEEEEQEAAAAEAAEQLVEAVEAAAEQQLQQVVATMVTVDKAARAFVHKLEGAVAATASAVAAAVDAATADAQAEADAATPDAQAEAAAVTVPAGAAEATALVAAGAVPDAEREARAAVPQAAAAASAAAGPSLAQAAAAGGSAAPASPDQHLPLLAGVVGAVVAAAVVAALVAFRQQARASYMPVSCEERADACEGNGSATAAAPAGYACLPAHGQPLLKA